MFHRKVRLLGLTVVTLILPLAVWVAYVALAPVELGAAEPTEDTKPAREITALRKARVALAQKGYEAAVPALRQTRRMGDVLIQDGKPDEVYKWSVRWLQAERDMSPKKADEVAALEAHLKRMTELEKVVGTQTGVLLPQRAKLDAEWYCLEAQLWLAQAKAK